MNQPYEMISEIQRRVKAENYRVRSHAVKPMIEEGFDEKQLLEEYSEGLRCLALGRFHFAANAISPPHIVCDLSLLDIVTAYIPQRPWWNTPAHRGEKR